MEVRDQLWSGGNKMRPTNPFMPIPENVLRNPQNLSLKFIGCLMNIYLPTKIQL